MMGGEAEMGMGQVGSGNGLVQMLKVRRHREAARGAEWEIRKEEVGGNRKGEGSGALE